MGIFHAKTQRNAKAQRGVKDSDVPEALDPPLRLCVFLCAFA